MKAKLWAASGANFDNIYAQTGRDSQQVNGARACPIILRHGNSQFPRP